MTRRYFAVEFHDPARHLIHNGIMTADEAFAYLARNGADPAFCMSVQHEVPLAEVMGLTDEERGAYVAR